MNGRRLIKKKWKTNDEMKKKYTNERINEHKKEKRLIKIKLKFMVFKKSLGFWYLWKIK